MTLRQNRVQSLVSQQPLCQSYMVHPTSRCFIVSIRPQLSHKGCNRSGQSLRKWLHQIAVCESCVTCPYSGYEYILWPIFLQTAIYRLLSNYPTLPYYKIQHDLKTINLYCSINILKMDIGKYISFSWIYNSIY
jgi:hypothetical protein